MEDANETGAIMDVATDTAGTYCIFLFADRFVGRFCIVLRQPEDCCCVHMLRKGIFLCIRTKHLFCHIFWHISTLSTQRKKRIVKVKNPGYIVRHIEGCYDSGVSYGIG